MDEEPMSLQDVFLDHARYGEVEDLAALVSETAGGATILASARDDQGNSCMHMAAANGHQDVVSYLVEQLPPSHLAPVNTSGSNPVHWACLNAHLDILRILCPALSDEPLMQKDRAGMTPLEVAEAKGTSMALECAGFILGILSMREKEAKAPKTTDESTDLEEDLRRASLDDAPRESGPER